MSGRPRYIIKKHPTLKKGQPRWLVLDRLSSEAVNDAFRTKKEAVDTARELNYLEKHGEEASC